MSSTSNVQNLLVNVIRPTYRWESGTGFVPSVVLSNITEVIAGRVTTSALVVSDSKVNTYIGSNAGLFASNTFSNVGIGYSAMGGASNAQSNVAIGTFALEGASNVNSNVAIGAGTDISGAGDRNVLIGTNVVVASGSNNILIGTNITRANESNKLQIGPLLYGDICQGYIGINNPNPQAALDISGFVVFRDKVGFQNPNPQYSLDVTGSVGVSERFFGGPGSVTAPIYSFSNSCNSGLYVPPVDTSLGTSVAGVGAFGIVVNSNPAAIFASNKVQFFQNLDVSGTFSACNVNIGAFSVVDGNANGPSITFTNDTSLGLFRAGTGILGITSGGVQRVTLSNGFLGIGTATPRVALDVSGDISANVYNGPGGTAGAPHYTFSDDRTTGLFFPGSNMVALTAGGTERMRISNNRIGIGTTAPANALDVSGVLRVIGANGNITFSNGTVDISGTQVFNASGTLSNASTTSNRIGGVLLTNADLSAERIFAPVLRNALTPSTYDISGGNISNAGATRSSNFLAAPGGASRPAYAFTTDPSSGLDLVGTSYMAFDTSGVQRMCISGNLVGIGTTAPASILDISFGGGSFGGRPGLLVQTCGMTLSNTPGYGTLKIRGGVGNDIYIEDGNVNPSSLTAASGFTGWIFGTSSNTLGTNSRFGFYRVVSGGEVAGFRPFTIDASTGFIGMGTSNPSAQLQVDSSGLGFSTIRAFATGGGTGSASNIPRLRLSARVAAGSTQDYDITGEEVATANNYGLTFSGYGNSNVVRMDLGNRRLGINTSVPEHTVDISSAGLFGLRVRNTNAAGNIGIQLSNNYGFADIGLNGGGAANWTAGTNLGDMVLRTGGGVYIATASGLSMCVSGSRVGIGTTAAFCALDVETNTTTTDEVVSVVATSPQDPNHKLVASRGNASTGAFGEISTQFGLIYRFNTTNYSNSMIRFHRGGGFQGGFLSFTTNSNNEQMRIDDNGRVGIGTSAANYRLDVSTGPTTASINMSTWPRYGASVSHYGVYGGAVSAAQTWTTSNAISADIMTVGDASGTYFRVNKNGIYSFNVWLGGTGAGDPLVYLDVSTNIGHSNINVGQNPQLAVNQMLNASGRGSLSWTGFLPSNSTYYYKIKVSALTGIATGPTGGKIYVCFLGEVASGAGVPF